ncbi:MAG: hypothetical protein WCL39_09825 [Armatimonadota bacterium]
MKKWMWVLLLFIAVLLSSSFSNAAKNKRSVVLFGYGFGIGASKESRIEDVVKRFGQTLVDGRLGHSGGYWYRSSDGKAMLAFSWSDGGLETVLVVPWSPPGVDIPDAKKMRKLNVAARALKTSTGTLLGDSTSRVQALNGKPDIKDEYAGFVRWHYVRDWYQVDKKRTPVIELIVSFKHGKVVRLKVTSHADM